MTFEKVKENISETLNCDADTITLESDLREDLGADSLDATELAMALESAFDITIEDEEIMKFKTVGDIVSYIDNK